MEASLRESWRRNIASLYRGSKVGIMERGNACRCSGGECSGSSGFREDAVEGIGFVERFRGVAFSRLEKTWELL